MKHFHIYGAGDRSTSELIDACVKRKIGYTFHDTRVTVHGEYVNIIKLMNLRLFTIPQVWDESDRHLGGFETAILQIK